MQTILCDLDVLPLDVVENEDMGKEQDAHNRRTFRLALWSIIVSLIIGLGNIGYQIFRDHSNRISTETRFGKIETALRLLTGSVAPQLQKALDDSLASALVGDQQKANEHIEFAKTVIHQLREAKVTQPAAAIETTRQGLETLVQEKATLPSAWGTAAEFISYRSALSHEDLVAIANLMPRCIDSDPSPAMGDRAITKDQVGNVVHPCRTGQRS
jgi:hypothetical protein